MHTYATYPISAILQNHNSVIDKVSVSCVCNNIHEHWTISCWQERFYQSTSACTPRKDNAAQWWNV